MSIYMKLLLFLISHKHESQLLVILPVFLENFRFQIAMFYLPLNQKDTKGKYFVHVHAL